MNPIQNLRATVRAIEIFSLAFLLFGIRLTFLPLQWFSPALDRRFRRLLLRFWGRAVSAIMHMRLVVKGTPPSAPFFLVSNHLSHLDGVPFSAILGCTFVSKSEISNWPVIGFMTRQLGLIFVDRSKRIETVRVNEQIGQALAEGEGIIMFAESTTSKGETIMPFKSALLEPAVRNDCPVHYATLHYKATGGSPPASQWICWYDGTPFGTQLWRSFGYPSSIATVTFGAEPISAPDRKILALQLHEASIKQFEPIE
ncbi:MAG: 1-acyl-sn-glycerol-3-phosphate acyltransferase [Candidatus Hydrogenedentes bacterium]|nr:1-acyl-sn-glycerol-3-phosphate acyltransferase [Candidatus Hydrogenedentota bacterium]